MRSTGVSSEKDTHANNSLMASFEAHDAPLSADCVDYLERLLGSRSVDAVWALHTERMARFGFDRLLYGFTRFRTRSGLGGPEDVLVLSNHSEKYIRDFIVGGMYHNAPMVRWATNNVGVCSFAWIQENQATLTQAERQVVEYNIANDVVAGYSISFPETSSRSKGAIGLVARPGVSQREVDEIWCRSGREIRVLNEILHLKIMSLPHSHTNPLTPRQRQVLEWVGDGKTTQDIATIMGLSPATVEKHLRLAREALHVDTTAQAILKASFKNQIFVAAESVQSVEVRKT